MMRSAVAAVALLLCAGAAHASGTEGSSGDFGSRNEDSSAQRMQQMNAVDAAAYAARQQERQLYARGQSVYRRQLTCRNCPLSEGVRNSESAVAALARVEAGEFGFEEADAQALRAYLTRRFRLEPDSE